jgi:tetratricopeptide (TPR) repeat protein
MVKLFDSQSLATTYYLCGLAQESQGDLVKAIMNFTEAIDLQPKFALAYYSRGKAREAQGDSNKAVIDFTVSIYLDPDDSDTYYRRASVYEQQGKIRDAIDDYQHYLDLGGGRQYGNQDSVEQRIAGLKRQLGE